ncbi:MULTISPECIES: putative zinc-binding metallopeptidase [unclassified Gordonia (in: high G+C Gram-positive bacteria)]|uniref:zinc-binding metallopeptidase family protein n=1 Tax=unclassified Gordonia (in: high G+C Gram-positive bacteria) TaxID=2657482 RepID=UPI001F0E8D80|nr:putative zinc-binding metallopeptidase [Gordonia sp. ABSL49_1]MCH5645394.1 putative zinc-binding peptidase [Gordonia sp. ABSL49_1]
MRDFLCRKCGQRLSFENSLCLHCQSPLGFWLPTRSIYVLDESGRTEVDGVLLERCANTQVAQCNWLVKWTGKPTRCVSCKLTRTRPGDDDLDALPIFGQAETAKRRVILELDELGLPITGRDNDPNTGLAFDLLSSAHESVITGHDNGVITLDLAEGDDVHREQMRVELAEPYRTVLGHFRHEIGHYYQLVLIDDAARPGFEELFGNPDDDYQAALDRHYSQGAPEGWPEQYVSSYATMHPAEDFAETFAHYLHIRDSLDTAAAFAMAPAGSTLDGVLPGDVGFDRIIEWWLPLSWSLNQINRSMGHPDLYPFVLPEAVLNKIRFVHNLVSPADE